MSTYCSKCGKEITNATATHCPFCGEKLRTISSRDPFAIICNIVGVAFVAVGLYYTIEYYDFVKFYPLIGSAVLSLIFFSLARCLKWLHKLVNKL